MAVEPRPLTEHELEGYARDVDDRYAEPREVRLAAVALLAEVRRLRSDEWLQHAARELAEKSGEGLTGDGMYADEALAVLRKHRDGTAAAGSLLRRENSDGTVTDVAEVKPFTMPRGATISRSQRPHPESRCVHCGRNAAPDAPTYLVGQAAICAACLGVVLQVLPSARR